MQDWQWIQAMGGPCWVDVTENQRDCPNWRIDGDAACLECQDEQQREAEREKNTIHLSS